MRAERPIAIAIESLEIDACLLDFLGREAAVAILVHHADDRLPAKRGETAAAHLRFAQATIAVGVEGLEAFRRMSDFGLRKLLVGIRVEARKTVGALPAACITSVLGCADAMAGRARLRVLRTRLIMPSFSVSSSALGRLRTLAPTISDSKLSCPQILPDNASVFHSLGQILCGEEGMSRYCRRLSTRELAPTCHVFVGRCAP